MGISKLLRSVANLFHYPELKLADPWNYRGTIPGFRQQRRGRHQNTCLTRHEQKRNPPGTKLWKACPEKRPHDKNWYENVFPYRWMGKPVS